MSQPQQTPGTRPQRDPPPALFLHPSPAGSYVSLPSTAAAVAAAAGPGSVATGLSSAQQAAAAQQLHSRASHDPLAAALSTLSRPGMERGATSTTSAPRRGTLPPLQTASYARRESTRATDRTDALWAEMQATLEEVELSASGGTRVFGPDHERKLAELRAAQIALAQAWARSEADGAIEPTAAAVGGTAAAATAAAAAAAAATGAAAGSGSTERGAGGGGGAELKTDGTEGTRSVGTAGGSTRPGSSGVGAERLGQKLEEETESDIQFARRRREANDRYFQRVNQGVLDVVAKLEHVASAMRAVEQESKDVWGDESVPSSARP